MVNPSTEWKDQFMDRLNKFFDLPMQTKQELILLSENKRLKALIGELKMELKKRGSAMGHQLSLKVIERNASIVECIQEIKEEHPSGAKEESGFI